MALYREDFPIGSRVRIADAQQLQEFQRTWKYHHKLNPEQLDYAGRVAEVEKVGFYHGGDVLYELRGVPGIWHEQCLGPVGGETTHSMTPEQIEEHNRIIEEAIRLIRGEVLIHGYQYPVSLHQSVRLKLERALSLFARALELNPENWSTMWFVGKVHQRLGDYSTGFKWLSRAHGINPSQADVAREASICAMYLGRSEEAISYARSALQSQPSNNGLQANLALAFLLAGRLDEARAAIDKAVAGDPADTISQTIREMVYYFIVFRRRPPNTTATLEDYWKKHKSAEVDH